LAVSKSVRFEIFDRDAFTCQYCGRRPPDVVLECDHIHPHSKGGGDEIVNLITSCYDCNRGKSAKVISQVAPRPDADLMFLRVQQEIAEADRYLRAKVQRDHIQKKLCDCLSEMWIKQISPELPKPSLWNFWLSRYGPEEIEMAISFCATKALHSDLGQGSPYRRMNECSKYVSGIMKRRLEATNGF
jgi:hypothetical protein